MIIKYQSRRHTCANDELLVWRLLTTVWGRWMGKWPSWNCQLQLLAKIQFAIDEAATLTFAEDVLQMLPAGPASFCRAGYAVHKEKNCAFISSPLTLLHYWCWANRNENGQKPRHVWQEGSYSEQISLFDPNHLEAKTGRKLWFIAETVLSSNTDMHTTTKASEALLRISK